MSSFGYFCYLAGGASEFLAYFAFVTFPLILAALPTAMWALVRKGVSVERVLVACVVPGVIPICLLTIGVAFFHPEGTAWGPGLHPPVPWFTGTPVAYPRVAIATMMLLHLPLGLALSWWAKRGWPAAVAATLWWGWVSICAAGMAEMSVTGSWQ